jgi:hypothetical protein
MPLPSESEGVFLCALIPEQLLQRIPGFGFPGGILGGRDILTADEFEVLAIVGQVLFCHRVGPAVSALLGNAGIVADTVQAHLQV